MSKETISIHWLSMTVWSSREDAFLLYERLFKNHFGNLEIKGNGGRGYRRIHSGLFEIKLYTEPGKSDEEHFHLEIPGKACEFLSSIKYCAIFEYIRAQFGDQFKFKRIDLAFDYLGFTPQQVYDSALAGNLRSLARRETLRQENSPLLAREDGLKGTQTVYLGSSQSQRMIRVYNKRGFTRLELQARDDRAHLIACELFGKDETDRWFSTGISHLRDYIDFFEPWWDQFIAAQGRAYKTLANPEEQSLVNSIAWVEKQASQILSVIEDVHGKELISQIIDLGRKKRGSRFDKLLERARNRKKSYDPS